VISYKILTLNLKEFDMKKLYRLEEGKVVAGICNGIADSYHFDVSVVRLALIFITVVTAFWPCIVLYLAGWFIIPEKKTLDGLYTRNRDNGSV
jgi:phage shock protein C